MSGLRWLSVPFLALIVLLPASAGAQAISGVVTDSSGAVLPGVSVEAASPALIERSRTTVTDGAGRYNLVSLSPGAYAVTFTLSGFNTVKREGIVLQQGFTAPVNVQMAIGNVQEVVQVVSEAPLVDVQNLSSPQSMTSEMLSTLPLGTRSLGDIANRMVGVAPGGFGTGGFNYRGSTDMVVTVDGNRSQYINLFLGNAPPALSPEAYQEYNFTSGIDNVESGAGGIRINVVPKDGGNRFAGSIFGLYTGDGWRSDNIAAKYKVAPYNFTKPQALKQQYDINPSVGGPILKDKLWYQVTGRTSKTDTYILNAFPDTNPDPLIYTAGTDQMSSNSYLYSGGVRLTWQASGRDKVSGFYDDQWSKVEHSAGFGLFAGENPEAMGISFTPHGRNLGFKWTRTQTSHLVLEGGMSNYRTNNYFEPQPGAGMSWAPRNGGVDLGKSIGKGLEVPKLADLAIRQTGGFFPLRIGPQSGPTLFGNSAISSGDSKTWTANAAATYITGGHTIKAGWTFYRAAQISAERLVGDIALNFNLVNGVMTPASIFAYIPQDSVANIDADMGLYVQDQWTLKRLTIKPSLRYDYLKTSIPDQRLPLNPWIAAGEQNCQNNSFYCARNGVNWKDITPRLSLSYDLFGNGKTALKGGFAKYLDDDRLGLTNAINPTGLNSITRGGTLTWSDLNGDKTIISPDGTYQMAELTKFATEVANLGFGTATPTTEYDKALYSGWGSRRYTWEGQVGLDHQILPRLAATVMYYHRTAGNIYATDNRVTNASGYDEYCVIAPNDSRLGKMAGQTVCGLYDITPAARAAQTSAIFRAQNPGQLPNFQTYSKNLGDKKGYRSISDGFEITMRSNLPRGAFIQGGLDIRSPLSDTCGFSESPEIRFCESRGAFNFSPRFNGAYTLPWDIQVSGSYMATRGPALRPSWIINSTTAGGTQINDIQAAANAGVPKTLPATHIYGGEVALSTLDFFSGARSRTVQLFEPSQDYASYYHQIDMRFSKIVNVARYRVTVGLDLYNALNAAGISSINTNSIGTTKVPTAAGDYQRPQSIIGPRQFKLSATLSF